MSGMNPEWVLSSEVDGTYEELVGGLGIILQYVEDRLPSDTEGAKCQFRLSSLVDQNAYEITVQKSWNLTDPLLKAVVKMTDEKLERGLTEAWQYYIDCCANKPHFRNRAYGVYRIYNSEYDRRMYDQYISEQKSYADAKFGAQ